MPHIEIRCFPGRTEEQKTACAEGIAAVVAQTLGCRLTSVSVAIHEVCEEDWKREVWDARIVPDDAFLYRRPGYTCGDADQTAK